MEQLSVLAGVIGHQLEISDTQKRYMVEAIRRWPDGPVTVTIKRERPQASLLQFGYYHGLVLPMIVEETCGSADDVEDLRRLHLELKARFLPHKVVEWTDHATGEMHRCEVVPSLGDLNSKEMTDYVDRVRLFAAEDLHLEIPEPDKDWKRHRR